MQLVTFTVSESSFRIKMEIFNVRSKTLPGSQFSYRTYRTRRMAIANGNGTCVSFCIQPKAQFGSGESRLYVVAMPSPFLRVEAFVYLKRV